MPVNQNINEDYVSKKIIAILFIFGLLIVYFGLVIKPLQDEVFKRAYELELSKVQNEWSGLDQYFTNNTHLESEEEEIWALAANRDVMVLYSVPFLLCIMILLYFEIRSKPKARSKQ